MDVALLVLRVLVGALFAGHGAQKLFGWFGGHGLAGTGGFFESIGLRPGRTAAASAGAAEVAGGVLLALGLATPLAACLIVAVMTAAIARVHWRQGLWITEGGAEYSLVMIAVAFAVTAIGAGEYSLDHALGIGDAGLEWGVGALAVGVLGGLLVVALGQVRARHSPEGPRPAGA